jgi:prepilin-type N-terminal cleavage/methylation domain-containing protein
MKNNFKKAFSLVEISIVILVIGILIAGISKGVDLVYDMRLATARALTDKAPMFGLENLELWLETTSENSLATGTGTSFTNVKNPNDNDPIGRWNDINPTLINPNNKNHAMQSDSNYQPRYIKDGINGLPALLFDGVNDYIASTTKFTIINNFTVFVVGFPIKNLTNPCVLNSGIVAGVFNQKYIFYPLQGGVVYPGNNAVGAGISICESFIASVEHGDNYMPYIMSNQREIKKPIQFTLKYASGSSKLYINSIDSYSASASGKNIFPGLSFGGGRPNGPINYGEYYGYFKGFIGEIIVYSADLNNTDRKLIEAYLVEKWRIKL